MLPLLRYHLAVADPDAIVQNAVRLLVETLRERAGVHAMPLDHAVAPATGTPDLTLAIEPRAGAEGFAIEDAARATGDATSPGVRLVGHDSRGLLYAVGHYLHRADYRRDGWQPTAWRGTRVPDCHWRGLYVANNFRNWNQSSPLDDFLRYLDELALWGMNTVAFNFHYYAKMQEPERSEYLARNRRIVAHAAALGIRVGLLYAPNHGHGPLPKELQASSFPDSTPARRGHGDSTEKFVCPSTPAGMALIRERLGADLDCYAGLPIDFISTFPYDAGGCGCERCWPWGARGFVALSKAVIALARERFPACRLVLCTWCYDVREESDGEYAGLAAALAEGNDWCDALMTDAHGDFPRYPLEHGVPGALPMINFAEISMWGRYPWGGSGANPYPRRLVNVWRQASHLLDGGLPYSEGRFEDLNKVTTLSLFWDREADADSIVRAYAAYEYGADAVDAVLTAVDLLETTYPPEALAAAPAGRALAALDAAATTMSTAAQKRWRWRLLYLRAVIDVETLAHPDAVSKLRADAYEELTTLYAAARADGPVAPRSRSYYAREDVPLAGPRFAEHIGEHASDPSQIR